MNEKVISNGPLIATISEQWIDKDNLRVWYPKPGMTGKPTIHSIVIESVVVEEDHRRQGHFKRFLQAVCEEAGFDMVVVMGVGNPILQEALMRWGWDFDGVVMDFYKRRSV